MNYNLNEKYCYLKLNFGELICFLTNSLIDVFKYDVI